MARLLVVLLLGSLMGALNVGEPDSKTFLNQCILVS